MNKVFTILFFCYNVFQLNASNIKGFDVVDDKAFYVSDSDLMVSDLNQGKVILSKSIISDEATLNALMKVAKVYAFKEATKSTFKKTGVVLNVTARHNDVLVVFGFLQRKSFNRYAMRYAVLAYNHQLELTNYYSIKSDTSYSFINFLPYYPLSFKDSNVFYLQCIKEGMQLGAFKLNPKGHVIVKLPNTGQKRALGGKMKYHFIVQEGGYVNPIFNFIMHRDTMLYCVHPFPILFREGYIQLSDTFHLRNRLNSIYNVEEKDDFAYNFSQSLFKETQYKYYVNTTLSMSVFKDTVILLVTDRDANQFNVLKYTLSGQLIAKEKLQLKEPGLDVLVKGESMYQLIVKEGEAKVHRYRL